MEPCDDQNHDDNASNKYYSIIYKVNLLPSVIYDDESDEPKPGKLLDAIQCQGENELEIFGALAI